MALQGNGTELDPYLITSLAELRTEITDADAYYKVTQDLDTIGTEWEKEWEQCTIACKQLDFNYKKLSNLLCKQGHHVFLFAETVTTIVIKNAEFYNIENSQALFCRSTLSYVGISLLTIINSSFLVKWTANKTVADDVASAPYGILGFNTTFVDNCVFDLKIFGTTTYIIRSPSINRCHFKISGDFTLNKYRLRTANSIYSNIFTLFVFLQNTQKIYVTGDAKITLNTSSSSADMYLFANPYNSDLSLQDAKAHFLYCYFAAKIELTAPGATNYIHFTRYQTTQTMPPCSFYITENIDVVEGIMLYTQDTEYSKVYAVTDLQAKNYEYLDELGFDLIEVT